MMIRELERGGDLVAASGDTSDRLTLVGLSKRENNSHIDCGCPREKKIPVLELEFIKAQRTKAEGQGSMQMGSIDYSETKKQIANAKKREQIREREQKKKMKSEEAIQREEELCQDIDSPSRVTSSSLSPRGHSSARGDADHCKQIYRLFSHSVFYLPPTLKRRVRTIGEV
ncbi:hypothetical protein Hamer_G028664 [Homarus americanus]|uniref:Uncharacterized protein n=1 Tax=Homarus americanus TaxID=6706 RepID=A0A8J5K9M3_HOMAM|nr:hypothetical protein Hamer_G028664 [Homarus americanus]